VDGEEDRHELVVTRDFLAAWLVRDAVHAPKWRRLGLNHGDVALTVIRYAPGRPACVLLSSDLRHPPTELRRTGFPPSCASEEHRVDAPRRLPVTRRDGLPRRASVRHRR
jgi:hypothetical protein